MSITKHCSSCSKPFTCQDVEGTCWCMELPPLLDVDEALDCLCASCLNKLVTKQIIDYCARVTPEIALQNKVKDFSQSNKLVENIDYYFENGLYVFTKWFHLKRGSCCGNGCRNCPYGNKK